MYSSDGNTDPSKSDDDDISISIHSSISSPTVLSQTLLYSIQLPLLLNTRHYPTLLKTTDKNEEQPDNKLRLTRTQGLYSVGFESTLKVAFKVTLKVIPTVL